MTTAELEKENKMLRHALEEIQNTLTDENIEKIMTEHKTDRNLAVYMSLGRVDGIIKLALEGAFYL